MVSASALSRISHDENQQPRIASPVASDVAASVARAWMAMTACEHILADAGRGVVAWRAAPAAQMSMAAIVADMMSMDTRVMCCGFQPWAWMSAAGITMKDIVRIHTGKKLPAAVSSFSAEDICQMMASAPRAPMVVAINVDDAAGWNDVRAISAAAVKSEIPMMMLVSANMPAPEGAAIETVQDWNDAVHAVRGAMGAVAGQGAIRVIAMADIAVPEMERAMMDAAGITPETWMDVMAKNIDGAESAATAAYQAPVESF